MKKIRYKGCELVKFYNAIQISYKSGAAAGYAMGELKYGGMKNIVKYGKTITVYTEKSLEEFIKEFRRYIN